MQINRFGMIRTLCYNCKIYDFGNFVVENLIEGLNEKGLKDISFDLVVTSWCLRHLVDPVGAVLQVHELLSLEPNSGYFLFDGFIFDIEGIQVEHYRQKMDALLGSFGEPFLTCGHTEAKAVNQFVLQKTQEHLNVPLSHRGQVSLGFGGLPDYKQVFSVEPGESIRVFYPTDNNYHRITGDLELFKLVNGSFWNKLPYLGEQKLQYILGGPSDSKDEEVAPVQLDSNACNMNQEEKPVSSSEDSDDHGILREACNVVLGEAWCDLLF